MKNLVRLAWSLPLLLGVGCSEVTAPDPGAAGYQRIRLDAALVHGYAGFGFGLFDALIAEAPGENLFISPTSAALALAMTYNGAAGETRAGMARTLGVAGLTVEQFNAGNRVWLAALRDTRDPEVELALANSIWAREGFPFRPAFYDRNREFYEAEVRQIPFDAAAVGIINGWVGQSTRGKVEKIVEQITDDHVMFLLNALYFKGRWRYRFPERETREEAFTRADGVRVPAQMMRQQVETEYLRGDGFQMVSLPYGSGRFSMVLALPDQGRTLTEFYGQLTPERWEEWIGAMRAETVAVVMPRFAMEWESSLKRALAGLGMGTAFDPGLADFSEMSPARLFISEVKQKTFVEVNEEGTEAAAVTVVEVSRVCAGCGPVHPLLRFDRPFFFVIRDNATGTQLFLGQVTDPSR